MNTIKAELVKEIETSLNRYKYNYNDITWINLCEKNKSVWWNFPFVKRGDDDAKCYCTVGELKKHLQYRGGIMEWLYCTAYIEESTYDYHYFVSVIKFIPFDAGEVEKIFINENLSDENLICLIETNSGIVASYEGSLPFNEEELYND